MGKTDPIPFIVVTVIWVVVGGVLPWVIPKGPNRGLIQTMMVTTAVCCYLFWVCTILMQLNPLFGPQIKTDQMFVLQQEWK
ncbi:hypothetical protein LSH36_452g02022 [Paralvinella palmiformis]|uniref:V-type proton ATPase subunit n=1 Tax=Paralvinella palmiformis TaxID=53620 RepID=A0AAD9JBW4_9ANNE|nr:hypothetical protein LSH36_452g02022 [Paralvinella palmiformis]